MSDRRSCHDVENVPLEVTTDINKHYIVRAHGEVRTYATFFKYSQGALETAHRRQ